MYRLIFYLCSDVAFQLLDEASHVHLLNSVDLINLLQHKVC